ncbi:iron chaperone [Companilactobacillus nantensis]|uniref:YdhG-like domain-containing protein n=1 Tax=Companilactobacillus nantensis DSM 16982 TaxID=1423774 RepID=A0A0R1WHW1_9LACO|nr:DUF1801 domain-containing protein [Companilactobacillus nantensis]KRM14515.1 hypothetical protein FD31_GL001782 [Companilactobacillus nantensis DSM 16982]GEO65206.1 hypothetical protein LNA01_23890 [Companilactobacillus nantensis]
MDEYLATLTDPKDKILAKRMHQIISAVLPDAEVRLSYGLVGYFQPKQVCFFGINKQHIGFYPTNKPIEHFEKEIAPYLSGKTTLKFPKNEGDIPEKLVQEIAVWNLNH